MRGRLQRRRLVVPIALAGAAVPLEGASEGTESKMFQWGFP